MHSGNGVRLKCHFRHDKTLFEPNGIFRFSKASIIYIIVVTDNPTELTRLKYDLTKQ